MLRLRSCILSSPSTSSVSPLHRLLSAAAAPRISPNPSFPVEEYLVSTCGLTPAQALKASAKLSHLKSPAKPDAVLSFLAGLGLSGADFAAVVARDPKLLCASVERTLSPNVVGLTGLGLSRSEIARLFSLPSASRHFRCRSVVPKLQYCLTLLGSAYQAGLVEDSGYLEKVENFVQRKNFGEDRGNLGSYFFPDQSSFPTVKWVMEHTIGGDLFSGSRNPRVGKLKMATLSPVSPLELMISPSQSPLKRTKMEALEVE